MPRFHSARGNLAVAAVLFILLAAAYWRLIVSPSRFVWFDHYDLCQLEIPRLQFFARSLHAGNLPLWNPWSWAGQPVLGAGQPGLLNPLLFFFAGVLPLHGNGLSFAELNWLYVVLHFFAALFTYLFCRYLSLGIVPSLVGSLAFTCTGFLGSAPWLDLTSAAALTPLIFLFAFRLWMERKIIVNAAPLGVLLGVSWWTGHHELPLIDCYAVLLGSAGVAISRSWQERKLDRPTIFGALTAFALAIPVSAIQTLPFYEFGHLARRWVGLPEPIGWSGRVPYEIHARYSLSWLDLFQFIVPSGHPEDHWTCFTGITILALAILALVYRRTTRPVRLLGYIALGSLIYALGAHTPIHHLLYSFFPLISKARTPARGIFLGGFCLSVLAAYGADLVMRGKIPRIGVLSAALLPFVSLGVYWSGLLPEMEYPIHTHFVIFGFIAAGVLSLWICFAKIPTVSRFGCFVPIALVLLESGPIRAHRVTDLASGHAVCAPSLREYSGLADRLRQGNGRIAYDYGALMTGLGDLYGLEVVHSFVAAVPRNLLQLDLDRPRTRQLIGVTRRIENSRIIPVAGAMPRAWIVHHAALARDEDDLRNRIENPGTDFSSTAISLNPLPVLHVCAGDTVDPPARPDTDTVLLNATVNCRGLLILSDLFYPGWNAYVDGKPRPIHEVFGAFRGIVVEPGRHIVKMEYEPASVAIGAALSLVALAIANLLLWRFRLPKT